MKKTSLEEAQKILMEEEQKKREECAKEIQAVLDKYGFKIYPGNPFIGK